MKTNETLYTQGNLALNTSQTHASFRLVSYQGSELNNYPSCASLLSSANHTNQQDQVGPGFTTSNSLTSQESSAFFSERASLLAPIQAFWHEAISYGSFYGKSWGFFSHRQARLCFVLGVILSIFLALI